MIYKTQTWKTVIALTVTLLLSATAWAQKDSTRFIHQWSAEGRWGYVFPTSSFLNGQNALGQPLSSTQSGHLKYSFQFRPHTVAGQAYIGAYQGIGVGYFNFGSPEEVGNPTAVYLFQGGRIAQISPRLSLNYEWNFGASFGWHPYDVVKNPQNQVVGSKVNAYLNANVYLNWAISPMFDLVVGASGNHFSNGNTNYPNAGVNTIDCKVGVVYNINRKAEEVNHSWQRPILPPFPRHVSYDLTLFGSWRKKAIDVPNGQIPGPDTYTVLGFNFAPMYNLGYKYRVGVSLDGVYDTSVNIRAIEGFQEQFTTPSAAQQLSLGLSARAEFVMPYLSIGIGLGTNILHGGGDQKAFYQVLTLKADFTRNSYLHVGYNLKDFHEPNYLMLGIGYRFNNKRPRLW